jgi:effector-binding domain-containing protein
LADVRVLTVEASPTAVVRAATTWQEFPALWGTMLDRVWRFLRDAPGDLSKDGHNVMLYEDDLPTIEVGVQVNGPFEPHGSVVPSILPRSLVATATHAGPIGRLGETHDAVCAWCAQHGYKLTRVRWEIYGDPDPNTGDFAVDVFWALATE